MKAITWHLIVAVIAFFLVSLLQIGDLAKPSLSSEPCRVRSVN
jgi:hypothetical protein